MRGKINYTDVIYIDAYAVAVRNGFEGTEEEWLESLKGADGKDGEDGIDGKDGATGATGATGEAGADGKSVFIRYSANADGTDFTEAWANGQNYIGFVTGYAAPTDKSGYTWCLFCVATNTGFPISVASEDEMNAALADATDGDVGTIYTMTGESTDTYEQGEFYIIEEVEEEATE